MGGLRVPRAGAGRPRCRPDAVIADKAYSSRAIRQAAGHRPSTVSSTRTATSSSAASLASNSFARSPPASTNWPTATKPDSNSPRSSSGSANLPKILVRQALVALKAVHSSLSSSSGVQGRDFVARLPTGRAGRRARDADRADGDHHAARSAAAEQARRGGGPGRRWHACHRRGACRRGRVRPVHLRGEGGHDSFVSTADHIVLTGDITAGPQPTQVLALLTSLGDGVIWISIRFVRHSHGRLVINPGSIGMPLACLRRRRRHGLPPQPPRYRGSVRRAGRTPVGIRSPAGTPSPRVPRRRGRGDVGAGLQSPVSVCSGSRMRKVAPLPGAVRTSTRPWCAVTRAWTMDRPSPAPPVWARVRAVSAR
ncbi:hypothetical protein SUDANB91_06916 [Streptomyces sp. SudanB91_2054]